MIEPRPDFCNDGTVGWGYDVCLQLTKDHKGETNVQATTGKITLYSPTTGCGEDVQEKIVYNITKFRFTPSFPGAFGDADLVKPNSVYLTASGTAYYDDDVSVSYSTPGVMRPSLLSSGMTAVSPKRTGFCSFFWRLLEKSLM